jgi:hypothetical protein
LEDGKPVIVNWRSDNANGASKGMLPSTAIAMSRPSRRTHKKSGSTSSRT